MTERERMVQITAQVRRLFIDNRVGFALQRIGQSRKSDLLLESDTESFYWSALWSDAAAIEKAEQAKKRIYISGPMTGYEDFNRAVFNEMATKLEADGYLVENPATVRIENVSWADYMKVDIQMLMRCDMVLALPGWQKSKGARLEVTIAHHLGLPVVCYPEMIELIESVEMRIARTYDGLLV